MKIVINKCYGGFGLSPLGTKTYLNKIGKECYFYVSDTNSKTMKRKSINELSKRELYYSFTEDIGKKFNERDWPKSHFYYRDIKRNDIALVETVEELGEKANGSGAELDIVEIPDGTNWIIEEYDGKEWVAEKHRTWN